MLRRLLRSFAVFLLVILPAPPFAAGQNNPPITVDRGVSGEAAEEKSGSSTAAFAYFVMAIYAMLVLTIVCMPSRKA